MGTDKKTIDDLIDELVDWDEATREEAAKALGFTEEEKAIDPLIEALNQDDSEDVRAAAALSLGKFYDNRKIPNELGQAIEKEESPIVRVAIANSIGNLESNTGAQYLLKILEQEEVSWVREAIIEAFGNIKLNDEYLETIMTCLKEDPSEEVRIQASLSLKKKINPEYLDILLTLMTSEESDEVRSRIVDIIAEIPDIKTIKVLVTALDDDNYKLTQASTAEAVHKIAIKLGYTDENEMLDTLEI